MMLLKTERNFIEKLNFSAQKLNFPRKNSIFPRRNSIFDYIFSRAKPKSAPPKKAWKKVGMSICMYPVIMQCHLTSELHINGDPVHAQIDIPFSYL